MGKEEKPSPLENIVFYAGILILAGLLGYLIFQVFRDDSSPAELTVDIQPLPEQECGFEVTMENEGGTTAERVEVILDLYNGGEKLDRTYARLDYLPIGSRQKVRVEFKNQTGGCDSLVVASLLFLEP